MEVRWTETAFESLASIKALISQDSPPIHDLAYRTASPSPRGGAA
jgi:hypothetical protein